MKKYAENYTIAEMMAAVCSLQLSNDDVAFVGVGVPLMAGAVAVSSLGFMLARRRGAPVWAGQSLWPTRRDIDAPLVTGAVLFGIGWGLVGLCPGPALVNLAGLGVPVIVFVAAMAAGMIGFDAWSKQKAATPDRSAAAIATSTDG
mgnify:CR=1 FL=1